MSDSDAHSPSVTGVEGSAGDTGVGPSNPDAEGARAQQVLRPVRRRRNRHVTLSGPVTVLSPLAPATPAVARPVVKSATMTLPEQEQQNFVAAPTLNDLLENLAAVTVTLEELRRMPVFDFRIEPNQEAWLRLSRKADDLLIGIQSARRR
jgi:hypothetical protein